MSAIEANLVFEYTLGVTSITEYGVSFVSLASGDAPPPPEGARFDIALEGSASGPRIAGAIKGTDFLRARTDGRFDLHIHAGITTENGDKIALFADGVALPEPGTPIFQLRENVTLFTSHEDYKWANHLQIWGVGTVNLATQTIHIKNYLA